MTNETINLNQSVQYTLSIRLSTDGFSFSIYNPLNGNDVFFRSYPVNVQHSMAANIKQFLADTDEIKHTFKQTNILVHTQRYTSVPLELYEDEQTELLFYQNLPQQKNEVILCNILGKSNVVILFALDKLSHLFLSEHFPDARFFASISPLTEHFQSKAKQEIITNFSLISCPNQSTCWLLTKEERSLSIHFPPKEWKTAATICSMYGNSWAMTRNAMSFICQGFPENEKNQQTCCVSIYAIFYY